MRGESKIEPCVWAVVGRHAMFAATAGKSAKTWSVLESETRVAMDAASGGPVRAATDHVMYAVAEGRDER